MMIINTNSWHYKYIDTALDMFDLNPAKNLCQYIRQFVGATIIYALLLLIFELLGMAVLINFTSNIYVVSGLGIPVGFITLAIGFVVGFVGAWLVVDAIPNWYSNYRSKTDGKVKESSNPFVQYVKDRHNKFCSTVEFKEVEKK